MKSMGKSNFEHSKPPKAMTWRIILHIFEYLMELKKADSTYLLTSDVMHDRCQLKWSKVNHFTQAGYFSFQLLFAHSFINIWNKRIGWQTCVTEKVMMFGVLICSRFWQNIKTKVVGRSTVCRTAKKTLTQTNKWRKNC